MDNENILDEQFKELIEIIKEIIELAKYGVFVREKSVFNKTLNAKEREFEKLLKEQIELFSLLEELDYQKECLPAEDDLLTIKNPARIIRKIKDIQSNCNNLLLNDLSFYGYINRIRKHHNLEELDEHFEDFEKLYSQIAIKDAEKLMYFLNKLVFGYNSLFLDQRRGVNVYSLKALQQMEENAVKIYSLMVNYSMVLHRKLEVVSYVDEAGNCLEGRENLRAEDVFERVQKVTLLEIAANQAYFINPLEPNEKLLVFFQVAEQLKHLEMIDKQIVKKYYFDVGQFSINKDKFGETVRGFYKTHDLLTNEEKKLSQLYNEKFMNYKKSITKDLYRLFKFYDGDLSERDNFIINAFTQFYYMGETFITDLERIEWLVQNTNTNISFVKTNIPLEALISLAETVSYYLCDNDYLHNNEVIDEVFEKFSLKYGICAKMISKESEKYYWSFRDRKTDFKGFACEIEEELVLIYHLPLTNNLSVEDKKKLYDRYLEVALHMTQKIYAIAAALNYNFIVVGHNLCGNIAQAVANEFNVNSLSIIPEIDLNHDKNFKYSNNLIIENQKSIIGKYHPKEFVGDFEERRLTKNIYVVKEGIENFVGEQSYLTGKVLTVEDIDYNFIGTEFGELERGMDYLVSLYTCE